MCARNIAQRKILRRRAYEDEIVVLRIVKRKQTPALYANSFAQLIEYAIQIVHGNHFPYAGVMVQDRLPRIMRRIEISQSGFRSANKCAIAEYDPWFRGAIYELPTEKLERRNRFSLPPARAPRVGTDSTFPSAMTDGASSGSHLPRVVLVAGPVTEPVARHELDPRRGEHVQAARRDEAVACQKLATDDAWIGAHDARLGIRPGKFIRYVAAEACVG